MCFIHNTDSYSYKTQWSVLYTTSYYILKVHYANTALIMYMYNKAIIAVISINQLVHKMEALCVF
jgi:hypothetical protein